MSDEDRIQKTEIIRADDEDVIEYAEVLQEFMDYVGDDFRTLAIMKTFVKEVEYQLGVEYSDMDSGESDERLTNKYVFNPPDKLQ